MPGARTTDQLCASEVHQAGFSSDFYYPLVPRVQNDAYIANEIATDFKTEFFNSIDPMQPLDNRPTTRTIHEKTLNAPSAVAYRRGSR